MVDGAFMDFGYSEEQLMIQDVARRIAREKIAPAAEHFDRTGEFPKALAAHGTRGI